MRDRGSWARRRAVDLDHPLRPQRRARLQPPPACGAEPQLPRRGPHRPTTTRSSSSTTTPPTSCRRSSRRSLTRSRRAAWACCASSACPRRSTSSASRLRRTSRRRARRPERRGAPRQPGEPLAALHEHGHDLRAARGSEPQRDLRAIWPTASTGCLDSSFPSGSGNAFRGAIPDRAPASTALGRGSGSTSRRSEP